MDVVIERIFMESKLSDKFKKCLLFLLNNYQDLDYGYITVGDAYFIVKDLLILEKDLINHEFKNDTYITFIYTYVKRYCLKEKDNIIVWKKMYETLIKNTILNKDNRNYFINLKKPESGIISFIKTISLLVEELNNLINKNDYISVLKKYNELIEICNTNGIEKDILDNTEELTKILEIKYSIYSPLRNYKTFLKSINKRELTIENEYGKENFVHIKNSNPESIITQQLIHEKMLNYYKDTGYLLRPYKRDVNIYYLKNIAIVAYKYDDTPNMNLKKNKISLNWNDRDFWAKIFDKNVDYVEGNDINYFITDGDEHDLYKVVPTTFQDKFYESLGSNVIYTPEEYLDEALFKYLKHFNMENIYNIKNTDKLMTTDHKFYFKDPTLIDELLVENIEEYKYLNLIKTSNSRNRTLGSIISHSKKNPKKEDIKQETKKAYSKKLSYNKPEHIWLPYKDN